MAVSEHIEVLKSPMFPHSTPNVPPMEWHGMAWTGMTGRRTLGSRTGAEPEGNWNWADVDESMTMSTRPTEVVSAVRQWMTINFHLIGFI